MNRLVDKVVVITGAGSGIGRASAKMFAAEGAKVVVAELDETLGEASAREAGTGATLLPRIARLFPRHPVKRTHPAHAGAFLALAARISNGNGFCLSRACFTAIPPR